MKHTGGCHCGAVRFAAEADITNVVECNCSHCQMKGLLLAFMPGDKFMLTKGEENLTLYEFNTKKIEHFFCTTCGVQPFARGKDKDGNPTATINIRCVDDIDLASLTRTPYDGKDI